MPSHYYRSRYQPTMYGRLRYKRRGYGRSRWPTSKSYRRAARGRIDNSARQMLGNNKLVYLKYNTMVELNPVSNPGVAVNVFSANGMFDPDITGTGHQPRGFDELLALFNHFTVLESTIIVRCPPSQVNTLMFGISLQAQTALQTTLVNYNETRNSVWKTSGLSAGSSVVLKLKYSPRDFLGRSNPMADNLLRGSVGANPTEGAFFHVYAGAMFAGVNPSPLVIDCTIEFKAMLTEPFQPLIS